MPYEAKKRHSKYLDYHLFLLLAGTSTDSKFKKGTLVVL